MGIPLSAAPRNMVASGMNREQRSLISTLLFQYHLIIEEIMGVYLMIFKYHLCVIILLNTQNTTESAKQIYIAWQTFIS